MWTLDRIDGLITKDKMNPKVERFLERIRVNKRPSLDKVWNWLEGQSLTPEERTQVELRIRNEYNQLTTHSDDFGKLVESTGIKGFVKEYLIHTETQRAPTSYHFATAMTLLGASLRRRVFVDHGFFKIWPALQCMLVGPAGIGKSTATDYGVMDLAMSSKVPHFNLMADSGSAIGLFADLEFICNGRKKSKNKDAIEGQGDTTGLIYLSEMSKFISGQDYNKELVAELTDLFDSRARVERSTRGHGKESLKDIALSALFNTNPDWLAKGLDRDVFGGGFFSRVLVFYETLPRPDTDGINLPDIPQGQRIMSQLASCRFMLGPAELSKEAMGLYASLTKKYRESNPGDYRLKPLWLRVPPHILRMAMLLSISESMLMYDASNTRPPPEIETKHLEQAEAVLGYIVGKLPHVYNLVGKTFWGDIRTEIFNIIEAKGGWCSKIELKLQMGLKIPPQQLTIHLKALVDDGVIKSHTIRMLDDIDEPGWKLVGKL